MEILSEKYRPKTLDDMVLSETIRKVIQSNIKDKKFNHLLLYGMQGIGKTTLAQIISRMVGKSVLYINASIHNSVDDMRTKVCGFTECPSMDGLPKTVILDEADALTSNSGNGSSAQSALRNIIENAQDDTIFILTCNYVDKIIKPLQSRCTPINLKFSVEDATTRIVNILTQEGIKFDMDTLQEFVAMVVVPNFPDMRSIINSLSLWTVGGVLVNMGEMELSEIDSVVRRILDAPTTTESRKWYLANENKFSGDYQMLLGKIFNYVEEPTRQIVIADGLYRMGIVLDKEIQFYTTLMQLKLM